jgi:phosphatidylserine decarboxylase
MTAAALGAAVALGTLLALTWKWQLGTLAAVVAPLLAAAGAAVSVPLADALGAPGALCGALSWGLALAAGLLLVAWRFYRDPERTPPQDDEAIVSPADGRVVYVRQVRQGLLPVSTKHGRPQMLDELTRTPLKSDDAIVIGIALSLLDVHVNRAPIAGRVTLQRHFRGSFGSLRRPEMVFQNERSTTVIERPGLQVAVVLIASRLVRRIVSYVSPGDDLELAQRIGVIRFGSQVDVVLPAADGLHVNVEPGQRVTAGESVIAVLVHATPSEPRQWTGAPVEG